MNSMTMKEELEQQGFKSPSKALQYELKEAVRVVFE